MPDPDFFDFMMEGSDELLNTEECLYSAEAIYLDQKINGYKKGKKLLNLLKTEVKLRFIDKQSHIQVCSLLYIW